MVWTVNVYIYHEARGQPEGKFVASNAIEIPPQHFPDSRRVRLAKRITVAL
jgi:hypothetical protein